MVGALLAASPEAPLSGDCSRTAALMDLTLPGHKRDRDPSASRSRSRSRSASSFRQSASRGRSSGRPRPDKHKPAPAVAFATSNSELKVCHLFKKDGKCRFGSDCKYKH